MSLLVSIPASLVELVLVQAKPAASPLGPLPFLALMFVVIYFLMIRPQAKKQRAQRSLLASVEQGDRVVAAGGIVGTVRRVDEKTVSLQIADNVSIQVDRGSITQRLDKE